MTTTFRPARCSTWEITSAYTVEIDGKRVGRVERRMDSSRTGGMWVASRAYWSVGGFTTRKQAAEALVAHLASLAA